MNYVKEKDIKYHLSPMSDWNGLIKEGGRTIISRGEGIYVWNNEGKRYLDGMSGLWCVNMGYSCNPIKKAITDHLNILPYYNSFFKTSNEPTAELSYLLSQITPQGIDHFFYGCTGSDANDTIFKLVRRFRENQGKPKKKIFISRKNSYHGSTVLSAALGGMNPMHELNALNISDIVHIDQPYTFDAGKPLNDEEFGLACAKQLENKIIELGEDRVAAFIGEPIQGAGGVIIPPDSYWPEVSRICRKYDVLLISDEVICGFGRTGKWFGCENWNIQPDLMTMAKGITSAYFPLSAVGVSDKIYQILTNTSKDFTHGYTYSAHPVATSAAVATLSTMFELKLVNKVATVSAPYFQEQGNKIKTHPIIGEVRSKGMLMAFELVKNIETRERFKEDIGKVCRDICMETGIIMRACKHTMVLSPPLVITQPEIDELFCLIRKAFDLTLEKSKSLN